MAEVAQNTVFVGNLPNDADNDELMTSFKHFGRVNSVRIMDGKTGGKYAFVTFAEEESAAAAIAHKRHVYKDVTITVKPAVKRRDNNKIPAHDQQHGSIASRSNSNKFNGKLNQNRPDLVSSVPLKRSPLASVNTGDSTGSGGWKQNVDLQPGDQVTIIATHVESPTTFYGQIKDKVKQQDVVKMFQILASLCNSCEPFSGVPELDKVYAAKFSEDGNWYRCKVVGLKDDNQCEIQYIDYGNKEVINNSDLRIIPSKQVTKPYAIRCSLFGQRSIYDSSTIGFLRGIEKLESLILDKEISARVAHTYNPLVHKLLLPLEVNCDDKDINNEMIEAGFTTRVQNNPSKSAVSSSSRIESSSSRPQESKPSSLYVKASPEQRSSEDSYHVQGNQQSFKASITGGFECQTAPTIDTWEANKTISATPQNTSILSSLPSEARDNIIRLQNELSSAHCEINYLKNELLKYQRHCEELRHLEQEKNEAYHECSKMKADFRALEAQLDNVVKQLHESTLNQKLKRLLLGVDKVKRLRLQFPSERQTRDNIEWASELLLDPKTRISLTNLEIKDKVDQLKKEYEVAQNKIKMCQTQSELDDLIKVRDECRKALHQVLLEFDETIKEMPLEDRKRTLQVLLSALHKTHSNFLKPDVYGNMTLSDVLKQYADWKAQKMVEFREKRVQTNTCHNLLNGSLNLVQQELALDTTNASDSSLTAANIDDPLNKYTSAVYEEINVTDIENSPDSSIITMVLKTLINEISSEIVSIDHLLSLHDASQRLGHQLSQWLEDKPDTTTLLSLRKTIKLLKSRLRHKLADKQDLEESDDCDKDELACIEEEVCSLREELQEAFHEEDKCLAILADLNNNHFPELAVRFPEAGIDNVVNYQGLVKLGRTLEYFNVEPLQGSNKPSVMKSSYCKRPIILKEYIVDDNLGVQRPEFLKQVMMYSSVQHQNLMTVEAVFSIKDKRNVYVQLPFYDTTVHNLVSDNILSPQKLYSALSGVLQGLNALHESRIIHGAIHPNNVFINHDGLGVLAEYDFAKTLLQRVERQFTTNNGLIFVSPEVRSSSQISEAADVYNFGLLALWLITAKSGRMPSLDGIHLEDSNLMEVLHATLCDNPTRRPSTLQLLSFAYFTNIPDASQNISPKANPEKLTLQLRPKQPSPPLSERNHTGILKNGSHSVSLPSVGESPTQALNRQDPSRYLLSHQVDQSTQRRMDTSDDQDREVSEIFTVAPSDDSGHKPDVINGTDEAEQLPDLEPAETKGYEQNDESSAGPDSDEELGFHKTCQADIPVQLVSDTSKSNNSSADTDLTCESCCVPGSNLEDSSLLKEDDITTNKLNDIESSTGDISRESLAILSSTSDIPVDGRSATSADSNQSSEECHTSLTDNDE